MRKELCRKLKEKLKRKILLCIAGTDSYNYNKYIQIDNDWKKYFRPIWIHDRVNMPEKL
jgi:ATP-dependent Clp protease ATP-binding subunit ClpA